MKRRENSMKKQNDIEQVSSYVRKVIRSMRSHGRILYEALLTMEGQQ